MRRQEKNLGKSAPPVGAKLFETSLIFELSSPIAARVMELRRRLQLAAYTAALRRPHMTLLFIGVLTEPLVEDLKPEICVSPYSDIEAPLNGWGVFQRSDGTCNIHLRVRPGPELIAAHQWALNVCRCHLWTPPPDVNGQNYVPHITVADGAREASAILRSLENSAIPSRLRLTTLKLRAHHC
jgi:2'-5' RNA ligase